MGMVTNFIGVVLATAALLAVVRIVRGPSLLDRVVAADVLVAAVVGAIATEAASNRHTTTVPILVVLAILGFVVPVGLVRFIVRERW